MQDDPGEELLKNGVINGSGIPDFSANMRLQGQHFKGGRIDHFYRPMARGQEILHKLGNAKSELKNN